jgi:GNAT superfamily N-acetyltransferase
MVPMNPIFELLPTDHALIQQIAECYNKEWDTPIEKTRHRLGTRSEGDVIFHLVACEDGQLISTGGLCNQVNLLVAHEHFKRFKPWVSMLYTSPEYRNQNYGRKLMEDLQHRARVMGFKDIYLYSFTAVSLYEKLGWQAFAQVVYKGHETVVMRLSL